MLVTLDLCTLRGTGFKNLALREGYRILVPEVFFHEIATASDGSDQATRDYEKFLELCKINSERVSLGKDSALLIGEQRDFQHRQRAGACINLSSTRFINPPLTGDSDSAISRIKNSPGASVIGTRKSFLYEIASCFTSHLKKYDPSWLSKLKKGDVEKHDEMIAIATKHPIAIKMFIELFLKNDVPKSRYLSKEWQYQVSTHPDKYALGKLARLTIWYCILYADGKTSELKNAIEDIQYIFLGSYTGRLATEDKGMIRAAKALWKHIEILSAQDIFTDPDL